MLRQLPSQWPRMPRPSVAAAAAIAASAALISAALIPALSASASTQVRQSATAPAVVKAIGPAARSTRVVLLNGDRLSVAPAAGGSLATVLAHPDQVPLWTLHLAGSTYDIPIDAVPYLGHGLDPSLFNLSLLTRIESHGRLPVRLSFTGQHPDLPGITITRWGVDTASGYLTAQSARAFGAALARQFRAGHATGNYRSASLFGGATISLAGVAVPQPVQPAYPMHTVTVTATNERGKPDSGDEVLLINADNAQIFGDPDEAFNIFDHGSAKYSLPAGHYWAVADFFQVLKRSFSQRMVVLPQFTVGSGKSTVPLAAKSANSEVQISTPRPASNDLDFWTVVRFGLHHNLSATGTLTFGSPLWISPTTKKPSSGSIQSSLTAQLASPKHVKGVPYAYSLDFIGPMGVIPTQHWVASPATLATVTNRYYLDAKSSAFWATGGGDLLQLETGTLTGAISTFPVPGLQTQYLTGSKSIAWQTQFFSFNGAGQVDSFHTLVADKNATETWNQYPLHVQPEVQLLSGPLGAALPQVPSAFAADNYLWLIAAPFSDNDSQYGHIGGNFANASFTVTDNGHRLARGRYDEFLRVKLPAAQASSVIAFHLQATASNPLTQLSPATNTTWTMHLNTSQVKIPNSWVCASADFSLIRHCAIQPLLALDYQVQGLALTGVDPSGPQRVDVTVGHIALANASAITSVSAQVSWDQGLFWQSAAVTRTGAGQYAVSFNPPPGVDVSLKLTATDAAGNSVSETITNAYAVGP